MCAQDLRLVDFCFVGEKQVTQKRLAFELDGGRRIRTKVGRIITGACKDTSEHNSSRSIHNSQFIKNITSEK